MGAHPSPLTLALERLTVVDAWKRLGLDGTPKPSCRSPLRADDRNASFSIYAQGRRWKDHGTGEGGDAADFVAAACNLSAAEGARRLIEMAGTAYPVSNGNSLPQGNDKAAQQNPSPREEYDPLEDEEKAAKREGWPPFETPTQLEIEAIARLRGLSLQGISLAAQQGFLYCADFREARAWIITDPIRVNAQRRRLDGKAWKSGEKAWSLPGSVGNWPVGLRESHDFPAIALLEGGPDFLSAFHFLWLTRRESVIAPVAILGAANWIPENALAHFKNKVVRIFQHEDDAGRSGAARWAAQLSAAGAIVDGFSFAGLRQVDGTPVNDLNDFVRVDPDQWETERDVAESAFDFVSAALTPDS